MESKPIGINDLLLDEKIDHANKVRASSSSFKNHKLGVINKLAGKCNPAIGTAVFYHDHNDGTVTVHVPYTDKAIAENLANGSLICSGTICNYPKRYIDEVVRADRSNREKFKQGVIPSQYCVWEWVEPHHADLESRNAR